MTQTIVPSTQSSLPLPDAFSSAVVEMFEAAQPAIVQVHVEGRGGGTGVICQQDGHLITNNHVVARDNAKVQVLLSDGRTLDATVLYREPRLDLAMLKVHGDNFKLLSFGDSTKLRVGELVFAIGHPWGQRWAVTAGIVSTMRTAQLSDNLITQYIQSDVRLAPGNSGGPLLNADGEVVGINAMIFGGDLSVAIPSHVVNKWISGLPQRGIKLGIEIMTVELPSTIQGLPAQQASGVLIVGIRPERQAKHSDLFVGDILLAVAGKAVNDTETLLQALSQSTALDMLPVTLLRKGQLVKLNIAVS
ncbi:MAG: trypsin-like peptidase domain-containing protein [Chloroflexi bacterium]|nr:trypsin-like peptidase domain-containing protein [Ktedonobacteraceae bacterium]MBV9021187.1 trypsin-like peptidase domain-containing protein [Ktedonobacteraceae bacterium]MBV9709163.1 trypsin-like peptidase domain-containing protein [Chloroflexota bacterium]